MRKQILVSIGVISLIGCMASVDDGPGPTPGRSGPSATSVAANEAAVQTIRQGLEHAARTWNPTMYRVVGDANQPDVRVQVMHKAVESAKTMAGPANVDFNVTTGSPVRTTPTTWGASFTTKSSTDMLAFAVDSSNVPTSGGSKRSPGVSGGTQNCTSTSCTNTLAGQSLYVLTDLYNTSGPSILYYNSASASSSFSLNGLFFNFNVTTPQLYALNSNGKIFCKSTPTWAGTGTVSASSAGDCSSWANSGTTAGISGNVTWSGPYPIYDGTGNITRTYFCNDVGSCTCVTSTSSTCTGWGLSVSSSVMGPPSVYEIDATHFLIFVGDASGNFYRIYDNAGTLTKSTVSLGSVAIHAAPAIDYGNSQVYIPVGGTVYGLPISTTGSWASTTSASLNGVSSPVDAWPTIDATNNYLYVLANNTIYKASTSATGLTGTVYSRGLYRSTTSSYTFDNTNTIAANSMPLGYPLVWYNSVFVNTGKGGTSASAATGTIEQYGGCNSTSINPVLSEATTTSYGVLVSTGEVLDYATGNLNFGYENGIVSTTDDGTGGVVQYPASNPSSSTAGWACPSPYTGGSTTACGSYGCSLASGTCVSNSDCSATASTPICDTSTNKCVGCTANSDCGSGYICNNAFSTSSFTCLQTTTCTQDSNCTNNSLGKTICDLTSTSPYYETCEQCATGKTANCVSTKPTCDLTTTDSTFDTCVGCSPVNSTYPGTNNGCTTKTPICSSTAICVQCTSNSNCPGIGICGE